MIARPDLPTTTPPPATRTELRTHYRRIQQMIQRERRNRDMFMSLETLGQWIAQLLPPEPEQAALINIAERKGY